MLFRNTAAPFVVAVSLLLCAGSASAQCAVNPTRETAVGLRNSSSVYLRFFVNGKPVGAVPPGDRSVDYVVRPGPVRLRVETVETPTRSLDKVQDVPAGKVCTWEITD